MEVLYRAQATASGGGREDGRSATDDGKIDVKLSTPKEMGGKGGDGTNTGTGGRMAICRASAVTKTPDRREGC